MNKEKLEKGNYYEILFNLTFLDCIKHIRGEITITELEDLEPLEKIVVKLEDDNDYRAKFIDYVKNF